MVVFGRAVLSDGCDMVKVAARCSRRLLMQHRQYTSNQLHQQSGRPEAAFRPFGLQERSKFEPTCPIIGVTARLQ